MFEYARLTLTAWFSLIILIITILFSAVIYAQVNKEYRKIESLQHKLDARQQLLIRTGPGEVVLVDSEQIQTVRKNFIISLMLINGSIVAISAIAGYFLAGRTLKPIEQMIETQKRFVADASHELRTPLTVLRSEIEVGLRNKSLRQSEAKMLLASNLEEVISLQNLSEYLLELTQLEQSDTTSFQTVLIKECIDTALKKVIGKKKTHTITHIQKDESLTTKGIPELITELFVIILDNAIKYTPAKKSITITTTSRKSTVVVTISDQGIGIPKKDLAFIFDRFYRASTSRTKQGTSGYGLGLSIAKKITEIHRGSITVKSILHKGTTFTITLPRA
jgi:signal transduction histidine kinase